MSKKQKSQPRKLRQCKRCSNSFTPKKRQVYCSIECRKPRLKFRLRRCPFCKRKFRPKRKDAIYCSNRCRSRAGLMKHEKRLEEQGLSNPKKPLETRKCVCGISFVQKVYWQKYCSPECAARNRQQRFIERKAKELIECGFDPSTDSNQY